MIDWTEVIVALCYIIITGVLVPLVVNIYKTKVAKDRQDDIEYWVEIGVRWAKQWLQTAEGQEKKRQVVVFVEKKLQELGIEMTMEELDVVIEAIYEQVKKESIEWEESR